MNISEQVLNKIKKEKIKPIPKINFYIRESLIWILFFLVIVLGSVAVSVIVYNLNNSEWDVYKYVNINLFEWVLLNIPYFWVISLSLFAFFSVLILRHTKKGYRLRILIIVLLNIILSVLLGSILFIFGLGNYVDNTLADNIPFYQNIAQKDYVWMNPEEGLLSGEIISINNKDDFYLKDFNEKKWHITGSNILWKGRASLQIGSQIKLIGKKVSYSEFNAIEIRPWMGNNSSNLVLQ